MDLATEVQARYAQLRGLESELPRLYVELQLRYEEQKCSLVEYKAQAHYWEALFSQLKARERTLLSENEALKASLKKREQQLFGRSSEKRSKPSEKSAPHQPSKKRGQQPENKGPARREYNHLPVIDEQIRMMDARCPCCRLPYEELSDTEDSEVLEIINVRAYRRALHRKKYKRCCRCKDNKDPPILAAPMTEKVIPKSKLGISIWAKLLLEKYEYQQPLNRVLAQLTQCGLSLSAGTVTDGFKRLLTLLIPIYDEIVNRSLVAEHWHADETGWKVFEAVEGKKNQRWYLWIFHNQETVVYKLKPWRSSQVLLEHFGKEHPGGILNVDRYSAYKAIAKAGLFILAFCWAHVRRDFLDYAKGYPHGETWALAWVDRIAKLYHLNQERLQYPEKSKPFKKAQAMLEAELKKMHQEALKQTEKENESTEEKPLLPSQQQLIKSLLAHWDGLTVFADRPEIPMDNNVAERGLRSSVVGRKNYYGSGSVWSAQLAAAMFTIVKTLKLHGVNSHTWLLAYLHECAKHSGNPPKSLQQFLPWNMSENVRQRFAEPPMHEAPSYVFS